jgi:hypothetical protein
MRIDLLLYRFVIANDDHPIAHFLKAVPSLARRCLGPGPHRNQKHADRRARTFSRTVPACRLLGDDRVWFQRCSGLRPVYSVASSSQEPASLVSRIRAIPLRPSSLVAPALQNRKSPTRRMKSGSRKLHGQTLQTCISAGGPPISHLPVRQNESSGFTLRCNIALRASSHSSTRRFSSPCR